MNSKEEASGHVQTVKIDRKRGEIFVAKPYGEASDQKQFTFDLTYDTDET